MIVQSIGFWCSGVFFIIDRFPSKYVDPMSYNPILRLVDGLRKSISRGVDLVSTLNFEHKFSHFKFFIPRSVTPKKCPRGDLMNDKA